MIRYLTAVLVLVSPLAASARDNGPARTALECFNTGLEELHAAFTQTVINPDGSVMESGEGEAWVRRPDRFRWTYHGEFPELIVADGETVWLYDESLEQVTVKPQSGLVDDSPLILLADLSGLDTRFEATELGSDQGIDLLELSAVGNEGEFERVILGLDESGIVLMVLEDAFGIRTELRFTAIERNPGLPDDLFEFEPPPGVDVLGEPGGESF